jgi:hypothetical protein
MTGPLAAVALSEALALVRALAGFVMAKREVA